MNREEVPTLEMPLTTRALALSMVRHGDESVKVIVSDVPPAPERAARRRRWWIVSSMGIAAVIFSAVASLAGTAPAAAGIERVAREACELRIARADADADARPRAAVTPRRVVRR